MYKQFDLGPKATYDVKKASTVAAGKLCAFCYFFLKPHITYNQPYYLTIDYHYGCTLHAD
jgi:hypothetical protein